MAVGSGSEPPARGTDLKGLFDAFYERFILRDFFGKIIPGFIILSAIGGSLTSQKEVLNVLGDISFGGWLIAIGFAWILGFAVQGFGDITRWIIYYPQPEDRIPRPIRWIARREIRDVQRGRVFRSDREWYDFNNDFSRNIRNRPEATSVRQQVERFVVIKEACGNSYVAISLSLSIVVLYAIIMSLVRLYKFGSIFEHISLFDRIDMVLGYGLTVLVAFGAMVFLGKMHFVHVRRQYEFMAAQM